MFNYAQRRIVDISHSFLAFSCIPFPRGVFTLVFSSGFREGVMALGGAGPWASYFDNPCRPIFLLRLFFTPACFSVRFRGVLHSPLIVRHIS